MSSSTSRFSLDHSLFAIRQAGLSCPAGRLVREVCLFGVIKTAAAWQSPEVVKLLIDAGADVDKYDVDLTTPPLHLVAENGDAMIAMLLIKAGAEVKCLIERVQSGWCVLCEYNHVNAQGDDPAASVDTACDELTCCQSKMKRVGMIIKRK